MESKAKRTLVKSPPELWELADDSERLRAWAGGLVNGGRPVAVEVTDRKPERVLAWRSAGDGPSVRMALEIAEKGFGTAVEITACHEPASAVEPDALERLLDELGSPERRPFIRG